MAGKDICMIAHKGYNGLNFGNTELAFANAPKQGAGGAETDIRVTSDGVYVLNHDPNVVFADGTELAVSESTYAQLMEKPLKNERSDDVVYVCTLKRYLELMRDNNMICFVEMKGRWTDEQIKGAFSLVDEVYELKKCIFQSFDMSNLLRARSFFPELPLMLTYGTGEAVKGYAECLKNNISIDADYELVTEQMIKDFHDHNLYAACWTVNTKAALDKLKLLDLDFIESDFFGKDDL